MRIGTALVLFATALLMWSCEQPVKTGYVDNVRLYQEFELKQELERDYAELHESNRQLLDSLQLELRALADILDNQQEQNPQQVLQFNRIRQQFIQTQEQSQQREEALSAKYTDQVWLHLNEYVRSYAEEHGYDYLLGGSGQGEVMYAKESLDITDDLITYANQHYRDAS